MNKIQLFIEDYEIELNDEIQFAVNKLFEDINNPTTIINDYSKTVKIPFSLQNDKIFGKIYSPDRVILSNFGIGVNFDPYLKLDFKLVWNDLIMMTGYAKLLNVIKEDGKGYYEIVLNGELGKLFQEFKKITFVYNTDTSNYWINTKDYFEEEMNKELVYNSWNTNGLLTMTLEKQYRTLIDPETGRIVKQRNPDYRFTDICGFVPSNTYDEDFNYDTVQTQVNKTWKFSDLLDNHNFEASTGFASDTIIGDGQLPRDFGEFRSYYLQPFIYFNKLFKIFREKALTLSGYTFDLDSSWFSNENPYWRLFAMTLNKIDTKSGQEALNANNNYKMQTTFNLNRVEWATDEADFSTHHEAPFVQNQIVNEDASISCLFTVPLASRYFQKVDNMLGVNYKFSIPTCLSITSMLDPLDLARISSQNALYVNVKCSYGNADSSYGITNPTTKLSKFCIYDDQWPTPFPLYDPENTKYIALRELDMSTQLNYGIVLSDAIFVPGNAERVKFSIDVFWARNDYPIMATHSPVGIRYNFKTTNDLNITLTSHRPRSFYNFSLSDLWNNEFSLFDIILRYCKMFRIFIYADYIHKKLFFRQLKQYFTNYTIEDWSNKLDMSKIWKLEPVHWDYKYINFNYEDNESKLGEEYKLSYSGNYGDYKLKTAYNFNDDTNDLFDKCYTSIINTDNVLSWNTLYDNKIAYSFSNTEEFVYSKDSDNNYVNNFGAFYFWAGPKNFDTTAALRLRSVRITDDTDMQINANTYCYQDGFAEISTSKYASLQNFVYVHSTNCLSIFNKPMEYYTHTDHFTNSKSIYEAFWAKYINERYDIQNKKLTAYFKLTPMDFINFKFSKFIMIDNLLYIVNKIFDYDVTSTESTKIELLTILDVNNYIQNNY